MGFVAKIGVDTNPIKNVSISLIIAIPMKYECDFLVRKTITTVARMKSYYVALQQI